MIKKPQKLRNTLYCSLSNFKRAKEIFSEKKTKEYFSANGHPYFGLKVLFDLDCDDDFVYLLDANGKQVNVQFER